MKISRSRTRHVTVALAALGAALVVSACGGDDFQEDPPATSQVPASASQSVDGFIEYLRRLVVSSADMLEPVNTTGVTAPTTETAEPQVVN